jgi:hypothetical protein
VSLRRVLSMRVMAIVVVFVSASLVIATTAGCDKDEQGPEATATPAATPTATSGSQAATPSTDPTAETAGTIKVTWTAINGSARQDPIGLLSSTPLERQGSSLSAHRTVLFKPTAPDATSAKGKYVYRLDLHADPSDPADYTGTMTLDWTMTIVKAHSKSEFHAVYKGKVTATFDPAGGAVYDGHANGSVRTTDTFTAYGTKLAPNVTTAWFTWGFETPK